MHLSRRLALGPMIFQKFSNHFDRKVEGEVMMSRGWLSNVMGKNTMEIASNIRGCA